MDGNCALGGVFLTGLDADLGANPLDTGRLGQSMIGSYSLSRDVLSAFARGAFDGALYDYSNISSLNQLSTGTTPVAVVTDPVGLSLDSRLGLAASTKGVYLSGAAGTYLSSPDSVASSITGDIDIRVKSAAVSWTPAADSVFISKLHSAGQYGYDLRLASGGSAGKLLLVYSVDGTAVNSSYSTAATSFTNGRVGFVKVTRVASTGKINFFTSIDGVTWSQLGTEVSGVSGNLFDGTDTLQIGARAAGAGQQFNGKIYSVQIYNGINGTLAVNYNGTDYVTGSTLTSSTTGEVWTLNGAAYIAPDGNHALQATAGARPTWQVDAQGFYYLSFLGTDDSLTSATGGGGSAGFFWCGVVQLTGGAGTLRTLFADNGTNTGYMVQIGVGNALRFSAGNGTAFTAIGGDAVSVGSKTLLTVWDDGATLWTQVNALTPLGVARPVVVAGTAGFTIGKDNGAASSYLIGNHYPLVYFKDTGLTAAQRAAAQACARAKGGM